MTSHVRRFFMLHTMQEALLAYTNPDILLVPFSFVQYIGLKPSILRYGSSLLAWMPLLTSILSLFHRIDGAYMQSVDVLLWTYQH